MWPWEVQVAEAHRRRQEAVAGVMSILRMAEELLTAEEGRQLWEDRETAEVQMHQTAAEAAALAQRREEEAVSVQMQEEPGTAEEGHQP